AYYLENTPIKKLNHFYKDNLFWQQLKNHPSYDEFWQSRNILPHLKNIKPAVLVVGGFFDAEDLYGPFHTYQKIEQTSDNYNIITYGPWSHGQWVSTKVRNSLGDIYFGDSLSINFQKHVITPFFNYFLKDEADNFNPPEARMFDTGLHQWDSYAAWPPKETHKKRFYLGKNETLTSAAQPEYENKFISDIDNPVPYTQNVGVVFTPREYMTADQRFA